MACRPARTAKQFGRRRTSRRNLNPLLEAGYAASMQTLLKSVHLAGLFGKHKVDVRFDRELDEGLDEGRLTIIFDDNGRGKTTVLKAIHHLLSWVDPDPHLSALAELPVDSIRVNFEGGFAAFKRDPADPRSCEVSAKTGDRRASVKYDPARDDPRAPTRLVLDRSHLRSFTEIMSTLCQPPILVSDDRVIRGDDLLGRQLSRSAYERDSRRATAREQARLDRRDPSQELRVLLDVLGQSFLRATIISRREVTRTDAVYADVVNRIANDKIKEAVGDVEALRARASAIEERLKLASSFGFVGLSQLRQVELTLARLRRNSKNKKAIETVLEPFFSTLEADADAMEPVAQRVNLLVSTANSYLRDKRLVFSSPDALSIQPLPFSSSDGPLDPAQLSSGERHLLLLFGSAMIADDRRIILIDEPELSLGISWKRKLLGSLLELTRESGAQFVVASHSVEIISPYKRCAVALRP